MDLGLSGRVALVTGSWRGTGAGTARVLASEGATVLVHGFEAGACAETIDSIRSNGGIAHEVVGDIRTDDGKMGYERRPKPAMQRVRPNPRAAGSTSLIPAERGFSMSWWVGAGDYCVVWNLGRRNRVNPHVQFNHPFHPSRESKVL